MICLIDRCDANGNKMDVIDRWGNYIPTEHEMDYGTDLHKFCVSWFSEKLDIEDIEYVIAERKEVAVNDFWMADFEGIIDLPDDAQIECVEDCGEA